MSRCWNVTLLFLTSAISASLMAQEVSPTRQASAAEGNVEKGRALYKRNGCYQCHSYDAHGGAGARLAPGTPPLAAFMAYVRHPAPGNMPTYTTKVMPDADLKDVWAFLKSLPPPPAVADIPLLNQK